MKPIKPTIIIIETYIINQLLTIPKVFLQVLKNILADIYRLFLISAAAKKHKKDPMTMTMTTMAAAAAEIKIEILRDIVIIIEGSMIKY